MRKTHDITNIKLKCKSYEHFFTEASADAQYLLNAWQNYFGHVSLKRDDIFSKLMLLNKNFSYKFELVGIVKIAKSLKGKKMPQTGIYSLNFNRHLGCTAAIKNGILYRTLDVSAPALGETLHIVKCETKLGEYYNFTWPGFVGVATATAPKRFLLSYNEAPQKSCNFITNIKIMLSKNIPPLWLTRQVMENCKNYTEAKKMLSETPLCTSAIFTLMSESGEGCIIERTEKSGIKHELDRNAYVTAGNHWQNDKFTGRVNASKKSSYERCIFMEKFLRKEGDTPSRPFAWLKQPIADKKTRFACELYSDGTFDIRIL